MNFIKSAFGQVRKSFELRKREKEEREELRIRQSPDRAVLKETILPGVRERAQRILWIGCRGYTREYHAFLEERGATCWTIDIDPDAARFGHPVRHVTGDILRLETYFSADMFDAILCNGIFGWGVNSVEAQTQAIAKMAQTLRPGGILVLGWNTHKMPDPAPLLQTHFLSTDVFGVGARVTIPAHTHVYDFCTVRKN